MFNFLQDFGNYEERKVDRYEVNDLVVSTAAVNDGKQQYETAVAHQEYNDGNFITAEGYDTYDQAIDGHKKWVALMTTEPLPETLRDCRNSAISLLADQFGVSLEWPRIKKE